VRILGIDPGLATVGIGLIETDSANSPQALDWCTITTKPGMSLAERLGEIHKDLRAYIQEARPERAVVEKLFFGANKKTALDVAQARGVILLALEEAKIETLEPTPLELKSAVTGDGTADKKQIQQMVQMMCKLDETPKPDDAADALALALYGSFVGEMVMIA